MRLFDDVLDKAIEFSKPVKELANAVKELAQQTQKLATNVVILAYNQQIHSEAIAKIGQTQAEIFKKLNEGVVDTSMPDIDTAPTSSTETQNDVAQKSAQEKFKLN